MDQAILAMQQAVDVVLTSPHPGSKVAATLFQNDGTGISRTNDWPPIILDNLGAEARVGDSSGTVHAEVNCLLNTPFASDGASLTITDPCCPNCAKCIAEAGIKKVYIDHKGFLKDFAARRGDDFQDMSLRILAHAGISLFEVRRKEEIITALHIPSDGYVAPDDNPIEIRPCQENISDRTLLKAAKLVKVKHERWACALARDHKGKVWTLVASARPAIGYTKDRIDAPEGKYDFILEPVNRILMGAARHGLKIEPGYLWCSVTPSSRELVNLVAAGFRSLYIGTLTESEARATLESAKILSFIEMKI